MDIQQRTAENKSINLFDVFLICLKRKRLIVLGSAIVTILTLSTCLIMTPTFRAVTALMPPSSGGGSSSGGSDPCYAPMPAKFAGPQIPVTIKNAAGASIVLSVWLSVKNDFGECGYRGFNLDKGGVLTTTLPVGCYGAGAFINDPKKPSKSFGSGCMKGTNTGHITVGTDVIQIEQ